MRLERQSFSFLFLEKAPPKDKDNLFSLRKKSPKEDTTDSPKEDTIFWVKIPDNFFPPKKNVVKQKSPFFSPKSVVTSH